MTTKDFQQAMIPAWEEFSAEVREAWRLYPRGYYLYYDRAKTASDKYHKFAAELWAQVVL